MKKALPLLYLIFFGFIARELYSQEINNIIIQRKNVFDTANYTIPFVEKIANSLHTVTKEYVIEDELLFHYGEYINDFVVDETERVLRRTGLFSEVLIEYDSISEFKSNIYITTQDRWSTKASALVGFSGKERTLGGRFEESNLFGTANLFMVEGLYRSENNIGWQGQFNLESSRLFRTPIAAKFKVFSNKFKTNQTVELYKPYRSFYSSNSFGLKLNNAFGSDFLYNIPITLEHYTDKRIRFKEKSLQAWYSKGWSQKDKVFATVFIELQDAERENPLFNRAYDNTGKVLISFSSSSEDYIKTTRINSYSVEDLPIGGWGSATLGRVFPIGHKGGEPLYYVSGQGEKSYLSDDEDLYLFGQISASSCFTNSRARYTYQEFLGLGYYRFNDDFILTGRFRQQTVWNWRNAFRQLIIDSENGLRGYRLNQISGDNRIVSNIELRCFPNLPLWIFNIGMTAFWDIGTVWKQNTPIEKSNWHNAAGFGLRFYSNKASASEGIFRLDFAFNFDENKFAEIIFTTNQFFSAFGMHDFRLPSIFGTENDLD